MVHLGYCTNVHAGETFEEVLASMRQNAACVREALGTERLGLGLYLSARAVAEADLPRLCGELQEHGLYVFTCNAFPFGGFHAERVKEAVYLPDWTDPRRRDYTLAVARALAALAPADVAVPTVSTLPLGWRAAWSPAAGDASAAALVELARELDRLAQASGRAVRVCLEPEPGCALERTVDAVQFFAGPLAAAAGADAPLVEQHLGVCYDTCHQAVAFEEPEEVVAMLGAAGIAVGKAQLSSALALARPDDPDQLAQLASFDEPRYLHQVHTRGEFAADLPEALARLRRDQPWRVHFHVPIDRAAYGPLETTRGELERAVAALRASDATTQFEVETYTWSVLPVDERPRSPAQLAAGIARELVWAAERLE